MADVEKRVAQIEKEVTSTSNQAQALSLITYAEDQLEKSVEEISKIENANSPEGRHKLEEIVGGIFQTLKPDEMKLTEPVGELIQEKALEDAVVSDICNDVARILATKRDKGAIANAITQTLGLKLKTFARNRRLRCEVTSRIEDSKRQLEQLKGKLATISRADGEYLLVQGEPVAAERAFEQAKGYCGRTQTTYMIEGWMPTSQLGPIKSQLKSICNDEVIIRDWSSRDASTRLENPLFGYGSTAPLA